MSQVVYPKKFHKNPRIEEQGPSEYLKQQLKDISDIINSGTVDSFGIVIVYKNGYVQTTHTETDTKYHHLVSGAVQLQHQLQKS